MVLTPHRRGKSSHQIPPSVGKKPSCWALKLLLANTGPTPDTLSRACVAWGKKKKKVQPITLQLKPTTNLFRGSLQRLQVVSDILEFFFQVTTFSTQRQRIFVFHPPLQQAIPLRVVF